MTSAPLRFACQLKQKTCQWVVEPYQANTNHATEKPQEPPNQIDRARQISRAKTTEYSVDDPHDSPKNNQNLDEVDEVFTVHFFPFPQLPRFEWVFLQFDRNLNPCNRHFPFGGLFFQPFYRFYHKKREKPLQPTNKRKGA